MRFPGVMFFAVLCLQAAIFLDKPSTTAAQEPVFELPVELGRVSYPDTYASKRTRRAIASGEMINMIEAEKRLVSELGENVCIYPKVCLIRREIVEKKGQQELSLRLGRSLQ
ncbi:hypothetical protein NQ318_022902, partial [Aromia moschata]